MFKKAVFVMCVLVGISLTVPSLFAKETLKGKKEAEDMKNTICPVTGLTIEKYGEYTVEYQGKRYNVSSFSSKKEFLGDPDKYVVKAQEYLDHEKMALQEQAEAMIMQEAQQKMMAQQLTQQQVQQEQASAENTTQQNMTAVTESR